jgi:prepilin-type processing-associated H-X9-DG protein
VAKKATQLSAKYSMMTDLILDWTYIPHRAGKNPKAMNVLWGDGHAGVFAKPATFNPSATYWAASTAPNFLPGNQTANFLNIITTIQE